MRKGVTSETINRELAYAVRLAIDALKVKYQDGKGTVDAQKAKKALGNLKSALAQFHRWGGTVKGGKNTTVCRSGDSNPDSLSATRS